MEEAKILLADIIKDLEKSAASSLVKKAKDYLVDISKKEEIDVGDAYEEYLRKVYDTYSKSKRVICFRLHIAGKRLLSPFGMMKCRLVKRL